MPRERINTGTDKRLVRGDKKGQFKELWAGLPPKISGTTQRQRRRRAKATEAITDALPV